MSVEQAYNFRPIDEAVATSGLLSEEQLAELAASGYEAVINLLPKESEYAIKSEEEIVVGQGIDYRYIPVDFANPAEQDYSAFVQAMKSCQGRKVLIHCAANYRVSAFYAMYAYEHLGWPASRAREHIESIWRPDEHPPWGRFVARVLSARGAES
ncbi:protein tyrosine phosphatase family protein [Parahaliea aestuarii]|nr:protein tyrosine phosphatase family protein [Parahaliea aestuarii]